MPSTNISVEMSQWLESADPKTEQSSPIPFINPLVDMSALFLIWSMRFLSERSITAFHNLGLIFNMHKNKAAWRHSYNEQETHLTRFRPLLFSDEFFWGSFLGEFSTEKTTAFMKRPSPPMVKVSIPVICCVRKVQVTC